jgi:serine/threonine protein kinase
MDLKPANILVNPDGVVKIIDFGIARRMEGSPLVAGAADRFSGPYASPEQIQPGTRLGYPADIYSLGAVLYELLCGHAPFSSRLSASELERQIAEDAPRRPSEAINQPKLKQSSSNRHTVLEPEVIARMRGGCRLAEARKLLSGGLDRICLFALRKEAWRRYRSVDDLKSDVQRVVEGRRPTIARSSAPIYAVLRAMRQAPLTVMAAWLILTTLNDARVPARALSAEERAAMENKRRADRAVDSCVNELKDELQPELTSDQRLRIGLTDIDIVRKALAPVPPPTTAWGRFLHCMAGAWRYSASRRPR